MKKLFLALPFTLLMISCDNENISENKSDKKDSLRSETSGPLISFEDGNGTGFKDLKGNIILPPIYGHSYTDTFNKAIAFVIDSAGKLIAIDRAGKKILTPYFFDNGPDYIEEGLFRFVDDKKIGFADENGKIIIPAKYEFVSEFRDGRACFGSGYTIKDKGEMEMMVGGKWGFINTKGDTVIAQKYDELCYFDEGTCLVKEKGKKITIDVDGKEVK